jgi:hypothetical protein
VRAKLELVKPAADRAAIVDEFGRLEGRINWDDLKRYESLERTIRGWYVDSDSESGFIAKGKSFFVEIGPRGIQRRISSMEKLFAVLGSANFLRHCSFGLGVLEDLLSGDDVKNLTVEERTGGRKLAILPIKAQRRAA